MTNLSFAFNDRFDKRPDTLRRPVYIEKILKIAIGLKIWIHLEIGLYILYVDIALILTKQ